MVSEDGDGRGAVAGDFVELLSGGFDEFSADLLAEIFVGRAEVNGLSNGHAVVSNSRSAIGLFDDDVLALRTVSDFDGVI